MICSIAGCGKPIKGRGLCSMHSSRLDRNGDPLRLKGPRPPTPPGDYDSMVARFWEKVARRSPDECWRWMTTKKRYGCFHVGPHFPPKRMRAAHHVSFLIANGAIRAGMHVLHTCDNDMCVNPAHLYLGTHQDNMRDRKMRNRGYRGGPRRRVPIIQTPATAAKAAAEGKP